MEDVVVVGAGVVGCAVADALAGQGRKVWLLERAHTVGTGVTARNSEVIHAGLYYVPGSWKARTCRRGRELLYRFCAETGVTHRRIGKLLVACDAAEDARLDALLANARANGVEDLRRLSRAEQSELEPHVRAAGAAWSPSTGIVSADELTRALAERAAANGAIVVCHTEVRGLEPTRGGWSVATESGGEAFTLQARMVVNAAGLASDRVAALAGIDVRACGYELRYCKGDYFAVSGRSRSLARHLVYPVPGAHAAGLGVHVTIDVGGRMKLGPNAYYLDGRSEDYRPDASQRAAFHAAAARYLPELQLEDLSEDMSGIRPKLQGPGEPARDFVVRHEADRGLPGLVSLIGIESPGLTAAMALGEVVGELAREVL